MELINGSRFDGVPSVPGYLFELPFERSIDFNAAIAWWQANWTQSIYWSTGYILAIFVGRKLMASRRPFELRRPLFLWNLSLAVFSILAASRAVPAELHVLRYGFRYSVCNDVDISSSVVGFWSVAFTASKVLELFDTLFIVLRKKKLIFLHWYHHLTVLICCWYWLPLNFGPKGWFFTMNVFVSHSSHGSNFEQAVHAWMYSYYALRSLGIRMPRLLAMSITLLQISQMLMGTFIILYTATQLMNGSNCPDLEKGPIYLGLAMYSSYLVLFVRFFFQAYLHGFDKAVAMTSGTTIDSLDEKTRKKKTK